MDVMKLICGTILEPARSMCVDNSTMLCLQVYSASGLLEYLTTNEAKVYADCETY